MVFFTRVIEELLTLEVFIPVANGRHCLNENFDIEKLECVRRLPSAVKTTAFKEKLTSHFYIFVGNILNFAVANKLKLPFKLSQIYIAKLFNLFQLSDLQEKILLISIFIQEKASPDFVKAILKVFDNPENLLNEEVINVLDPTLKGSKMANGVRMSDKTPIYNKDGKALFLNMINFLYKTAYSGGDVYENFFTGMLNYMKFETQIPVPMKSFDYYSDPTLFTFENKLKILRKADIYLSGK